VTIRSILVLLGSLALCLGVGYVGGRVTYAQIPTWYALLAKPAGTPPNWAFPVIWNILYVMMGVSLWLLWKSEAEASPKKLAIGLFFIQLALNAAWAPVFFGLHQPWLALAIIVALGFCIIATIAAALPVNRAAALLLIPYLVWVIYATALNGGIAVLNS
jgi:translocator protein